MQGKVRNAQLIPRQLKKSNAKVFKLISKHVPTVTNYYQRKILVAYYLVMVCCIFVLHKHWTAQQVVLCAVFIDHELYKVTYSLFVLINSQPWLGRKQKLQCHFAHNKHLNEKSKMLSHSPTAKREKGNFELFWIFKNKCKQRSVL